MQAPLGRLLQSWFGFSVRAAGNLSFVLVIAAVAFVTLVVGEITPKSLGIRHAERTALFFAWPIKWLQIILKPIVALVTFAAFLFVRPFGGTVSFHASVVTADELKIIVDQIEEHGVIETGEKEMIHNVVDFGDTMVRKVMTPRPDITAVEADVDVDELIRVVTESGHSRIPVFDDDRDNVIGIIHVKDVLKGITEETKPSSVRDLMRTAYFIPENKPVQDLLAEMQRSKTQLAMVRDEYGAVSGLVTIEDLLEEIVGEIQDEYDVDEQPEIVCLDDGSFMVDGRMSLEDFNERMDVELPEEGADTVGGFVFGLLGHQPEAGEGDKWNGLEFRVETTDGRRIQQVRVIKARRHDEGNGAGDSPQRMEQDETRPDRPTIE
jgi:putative hemolysin